MIELKDKFESLPHIKEKLSGLDLDVRDWLYVAKKPNDVDQVSDAHWVNGAWYAYQEQNKKLVSLMKLATQEIQRYKFEKEKDEVAKGISIAYTSIIYHLDNIEDFLK
ncbi:hypothetical protein [Acinetobacter baumannii]|uniref:hypothetical protein n=1 Tax=Acinetobacter baumannii TaxID=470 RepID=UPI00233FCCC0|nr:hypothetical protein [Acinetobacter baumannii]